MGYIVRLPLQGSVTTAIPDCYHYFYHNPHELKAMAWQPAPVGGRVGLLLLCQRPASPLRTCSMLIGGNTPCVLFALLRRRGRCRELGKRVRSTCSSSAPPSRWHRCSPPWSSTTRTTAPSLSYLMQQRRRLLPRYVGVRGGGPATPPKKDLVWFAPTPPKKGL
jgi:hypothetical protein